MKVFISWSGERSKALAQALRDWLPLVLHYVEPWLSEADISAGERWASAIAAELETTNFGIVCVTPENVNSPWVLFETGALAKSMEGSRVIPLLFGLEFSDITGPLAQFQAKKLGREGLSEVIPSINSGQEECIPTDRAKQLFDALWPEFEKRISDIPAKPPESKHTRPQHEILEELVTGVRGLDSRFAELESAVGEGASPRRRRFRGFHPRMLEEFMMGGESPSPGRPDPVVFLMLAGFAKDIPPVYELLLETYRAFRDGSRKQQHATLDRLRRVARATLLGPMSEVWDTKEDHRLLRDLPFLVDHISMSFDAPGNASPEPVEGDGP